MRSLYAITFLTLSFACWTNAAETAALKALVQRQLPFHADSFVFHLEGEMQAGSKAHSTLDTFTLFDGSDGKVHVECSTKSACSRGLYTYLIQLNTLMLVISPRLGRWIYTGQGVD
jgi:Alpha-N-acetylglucosaminidase (NAGLU) N-terminal domain